MVLQVANLSRVLSYWTKSGGVRGSVTLASAHLDQYSEGTARVRHHVSRLKSISVTEGKLKIIYGVKVIAIRIAYCSCVNNWGEKAVWPLRTWLMSQKKVEKRCTSLSSAGNNAVYVKQIDTDCPRLTFNILENK